MRTIRIGPHAIGDGGPLLFIVGPCVIESPGFLNELAHELADLFKGRRWVLKASFDKANRTSAGSFRGPGMEKGLQALSDARSRFEVPVTTDIHEPWQAAPVAEVVDLLQIPAFLCRQTDLLLAAARTGRPVNVKKGQFLAPWDLANIAEKLAAEGFHDLLFTERGTSFGYNALVVDLQALPIARGLGYPLVFDATHSVQRPGGLGKSTGGRAEMIPHLARAAVAAGVDGIFLETHPDPARALSDGPNAVRTADLAELIGRLERIHSLVSPWISDAPVAGRA